MIVADAYSALSDLLDTRHPGFAAFATTLRFNTSFPVDVEDKARKWVRALMSRLYRRVLGPRWQHSHADHFKPLFVPEDISHRGGRAYASHVHGVIHVSHECADRFASRCMECERHPITGEERRYLPQWRDVVRSGTSDVQPLYGKAMGGSWGGYVTKSGDVSAVNNIISV